MDQPASPSGLVLLCPWKIAAGVKMENVSGRGRAINHRARF